MAIPRSADARLFYRCAILRFDEAEILLRAEHTTGAVYLAGYGVECMLKALVLSVVPLARTTAVLESFRGRRAHDYNWLLSQYRLIGGADTPREVTRAFTLVEGWSTDLRYVAGFKKERDARAFIKACKSIMSWVDGRF